MYDYTKFFENRLKIISSKKKVLDVGGGNPFQKYMAKYKSWFKNSVYETLDISDYYKPTHVGDIHDMPFKNSSYDAILCLSVLEHVENPNKAISEIYRILKSGGCGLFFLPSIYPYHARGNEGSYKDYHRFFRDTIRYLFKDFKKLEISPVGGFFETLFIFCPLHKYLKKVVNPVCYFLDTIFNTRKRNVVYGFYVWVIK